MVAPNVKTQEIDQSYRVSSSAGSSVAIVLPAKKGPNVPTLMTSDTEFLRYYTADESVPVGGSLAYFSALAVLDKSDSLWVQRAISDDALYGGAVFKAVSGKAEALSEGLKDPTAYLFAESDGKLVAQITEISFASCIENSLDQCYFVLPGHKKYVWYATSEKSEDPKPTAPSEMTGIKVTINENETVAEVARKTYVALNTGAAEFRGTYEDETAKLKIEAVNGGVLSSAIDGNTGFEFTVLQYGGTTSEMPALLIYGANQGKWNNDIVVKVYNYTDYPEIVKEKNAFIIKVYKSSNLNVELESWTCSLQEGQLDGAGNALFVEKVLEGSYYIRGLVNAEVEANQLPASETKGIMLKGGSDGSPVTDAAMIKGLKKFEDKDKIKITLIIDGGWATPAYHTEMLKLAKNRQDCFAILSTPISAENSADYKNAIVNYRKNQLNANTSYGAIITPHVKIFDYFNNRDVWAAPDGQLAGALINAERNYEIWYPVLGYKRGVLDVTDVRRELSKGDMNYLYDNGINPIRKVDGKGIVIWGQKTLQTQASALDRINVRMMLIKIEPAIEDYLENYIGDFNTSDTRNEIYTIVDDYLKDIQARNGIRGHKLICDTTNNTNQVISANELILWTYVIPPYGVEYITNKMIITPEGLTIQ